MVSNVWSAMRHHAVKRNFGGVYVSKPAGLAELSVGADVRAAVKRGIADTVFCKNYGEPGIAMDVFCPVGNYLFLLPKHGEQDSEERAEKKILYLVPFGRLRGGNH